MPLKSLEAQCDPQQRRQYRTGSGKMVGRKRDGAAHRGVFRTARAQSLEQFRPRPYLRIPTSYWTERLFILILGPIEKAVLGSGVGRSVVLRKIFQQKRSYSCKNYLLNIYPVPDTSV
ncbi:unnamed protein product [Rangifer tarandus platyrhynchus]|uniref:Uncharacterized protein n=1 Tax=Rangifer tarandus platyrhynchus TaxID=3082113 RepID=A0AC59YUZ6_RANTA